MPVVRLNNIPAERKPGSGRIGHLALGVLVLFLLVLVSGLRAAPREQNLSPEARQKLEALRVFRLTQELNLSEDQSAVFFPKLKLLTGLRREHRQTRTQLLAVLDTAVHRAPLDEPRIKLLVDSLGALDVSYHADDARLTGELNGILNVEQQARFILFQANFEKEMRRLIEQIRQTRGQPGRTH